MITGFDVPVGTIATAGFGQHAGHIINQKVGSFEYGETGSVLVGVQCRDHARERRTGTAGNSDEVKRAVNFGNDFGAAFQRQPVAAALG